MTPILEVRNLTTRFYTTDGVIHAVSGVSLDLAPGETLAVVGESGCGKSTAGRAILQLIRPTSGKVYLEDVELTSLSPGALRSLRPCMQMIFQDSYAALNPRHSIGQIVAGPLLVHRAVSGSELKDRVAELLRRVGLDPAHSPRYPHEFSGGQRQPIGIARALALSPSFIVCDEPISALDVSIQAQIVNLLQEIQERMGLTYLFIAHDLSMVRHISNQVAVMYVFHTRCPLAQEIFFHQVPECRPARAGQWVVCHLVEPGLPPPVAFRAAG